MWNLKNKTNEQASKQTQTQKQTHKHRQQTGGCHRGGGQGMGELGGRDKVVQTSCYKKISHKVERYSMGNIVNNIIITLCGDRWQLHLLW